MLPHELERVLQPHLIKTLYTYAGGTLRFNADLDTWRYTFDGLAAVEWQPVLTFLHHALEAQADALAQATHLLDGDAHLPGVLLTPVQDVPQRTHHDWHDFLEWNVDEDGPLHFASVSADTAGTGIQLPIEALEAWVLNRNYDMLVWRKDRARVLQFASMQADVEEALAQTPLQSRAALNQLAQRALASDPKSDATHAAWRDLLRGMARADLLPLSIKAPDDGGQLSNALLAAGFPALARVRDGVLALIAHAAVVPGLFVNGATHPLAGVLSPRWFVDGPYQDPKGDAIAYLRYAVASFIGREAGTGASWYVTSTSGWMSGAFGYAPGAGRLAQLVNATRPVWRPVSAESLPTPAELDDADRLCQLAATMSKGGLLAAALPVAAVAVLRYPASDQAWIELGMVLIYQGRGAEGIACIERAVTLNPYRGQTRFVAGQRAAAPPPATLSADVPARWLMDALPALSGEWLALPVAFQFRLLWIASLTLAPELRPVWHEMQAAYGDQYLGRLLRRRLVP